MSDWYYNLVWATFYPAFGVSSSRLLLHRDRVRRPGPFILAANHFSPYDVALLIKDTPGYLDFVSVVELFRKPLVAWFFRNMNAFPLDRSRVDTGTTRIILDRLRQGRKVALFPEGNIRNPKTSMLHGGPFKLGVLRLARVANVPIIPAVVLGSRGYHRVLGWAPLRRTVYGINYGEPILPDATHDDLPQLEAQLRDAYQSLYAELKQALRDRGARKVIADLESERDDGEK